MCWDNEIDRIMDKINIQKQDWMQQINRELCR